jgi:four helix bundle protein
MKNFRTYDLAVNFYRLSRTLQIRGNLKEQLDRAASSVVLNLAEGRGRGTKADQKRFFQIAMGSVRECQAILDLSLSQNAGANIMPTTELCRVVAKSSCIFIR